MDKKVNIRHRFIKMLHIIIFCITILVTQRLIIKIIFSNYKCFMLSFYGVYCPGCGGTRMIKALIHGELYQAFRYNPFMFITIPFIGTYIIYNMILYIRKGRLDKYFNQVFIVYVVLVLVWFIVRNMRGMEFLLPTVI